MEIGFTKEEKIRNAEITLLELDQQLLEVRNKRERDAIQFLMKANIHYIHKLKSIDNDKEIKKY